jgi:hypothetical protein
MTIRLPRLPFSVDPLVAEARRRARRRRIFLAVAVLALAAGGAGAGLALSGKSGSAARAPAAAPVGPAVRLATCSSPYQGHGCGSPDGAWSILIKGDGTYCTVFLGRRGQPRHAVYHAADGGCGAATWLRSDELLFDAGGYQGPEREMSLVAASGAVERVANFASSVVSANERWLAGELRPEGQPPLVAAISLPQHRCRVVAQATGPDESLIVAPGGSLGLLGGDGIGWRPVGRVRVASGPGVGFTRDSKALIVADDTWSSDGSNYFRKLVRYPLSAATTPCPAVVTAPSLQSGALGALPFAKIRRPLIFPLTLHLHRSGGRVESVDVTVNGYVRDAVMRVQILRGNPLGNSGPGPNHPAVFTEQVRMTNLPSHGAFPARTFPLATWTGTLKPGDWRGGCLKKQYEVSVEIRPAKPARFPEGEGLGSPWFRCDS